MAGRLPKLNASWFKHDANLRNDPRFKAIRSKYGAEGYGILIMLYEHLTNANNSLLPMEGYNPELIAADLGVTLELLNNILIDLKKYGIIEDGENTSIYSKDINILLQPYKDKRTTEKTRYENQKSIFETELNTSNDFGSRNPIKSDISASEITQNDNSLSRNDTEEKRIDNIRKEKNIEEGSENTHTQEVNFLKNENKKNNSNGAPSSDENSQILSFNEMKERLTAEIWTDGVCMNMKFDIEKFMFFRDQWISQKELSGDFMYPINKLRNWLMDDFKKEIKNKKFNTQQTEKYDPRSAVKTGFGKLSSKPQP
jgi:hypothetical protein